VLAETANAILTSIDATAALAMPGVCHLLTAKDIPGLNTHAPHGFMGVGGIKSPAEPLFVAEGDRVIFNGQGIGMILATTQEQANAAAKVRCAYPPQLVAPFSHAAAVFIASDMR
jgi:xanthine dehydrogenase large subunit